MIQKEADFFYAVLEYLKNNYVGFSSTHVQIIAHSMGGLVVTKAITDHPNEFRTYRIRQIICLNSPLFSHPINLHYDEYEIYSKIAKYIKEDNSFFKEV